MSRPISIIAFPSNLGLKEPAPGIEPGVKKLPGWLRTHGFYDLIHPSEEIFLEPPPYSMDLDPVTQVRNADAIAMYARKQAEILQTVLLRGNFALVLGGDCSILIGNALALKRLGNYKLFFIDGHTDYMGPEQSASHGAAGMDLAIVTGNGHEKLSSIDEQVPYFREENTWCVGNREYDPDYVATIEKTNIHYIDLKSLRRAGIINCVQGFFTSLESDLPDGFWIHLDMDVLDPKIMPAVDSPDPGGLEWSELIMMLENLLLHPLCTGLEITILDPDLDPQGHIARAFIKQVGGLLAEIFCIQPE
jgi:arginase